MSKLILDIECPYCEYPQTVELRDIEGESLVRYCGDPKCSGGFVVESAVNVELRILEVPTLAPQVGPYAADAEEGGKAA